MKVEDFGMLGKAAQKDISRIKLFAQKVFGNDIEFIHFRDFNAPFDMFSMEMLVDKKHVMILEYERSILSTSL
jgi:hypothetical protein